MGITWAGLLVVWNGIWGFLISIPSSFWGVLAGSLISIAGIRLTNKATLQRLQLQLESDRQLRAEERRMAIRRDAYLQAAEHVAFGINTLPAFGNLDRDITKLDSEFQGKSGIFARVYAIAAPPLTKALIDMAHAIGDGLLSGYAQRLQLVPTVSRRDVLRSQQERMLAEQARWLEELKSLNLSGVSDAARGRVIDRNFQFASEKLNEINAELSVIGEELLRAQLAISRVQMEAVEKCNLLIPALVEAMRKELGFDYSSTDVDGLMQKSVERQRETLNAFLAGVESLIAAEQSQKQDGPKNGT